VKINTLSKESDNSRRFFMLDLYILCELKLENLRFWRGRKTIFRQPVGFLPYVPANQYGVSRRLCNGPTFSKTLETRVSGEKCPKQRSNENINYIRVTMADLGKGGQALLYAVPPIGRLNLLWHPAWVSSTHCPQRWLRAIQISYSNMIR